MSHEKDVVYICLIHINMSISHQDVGHIYTHALLTAMNNMPWVLDNAPVFLTVS